MEETHTLNEVSFNKEGLLTTYHIKDEIDRLVSNSDENSLDVLHCFLSEERNKELRNYAKSAIGDIEYAYYWPRTEEERRDFLLARLVAKKYQEMFQAIQCKDEKKLSLQEELLRREVEACLPVPTSDHHGQHEYDTMHIHVAEVIQDEILDIESDIESTRNWINQAIAMITIPKYKSVPKSVFSHVKLDGDEFDWEEDKEEDDFLSADDEVSEDD